MQRISREFHPRRCVLRLLHAGTARESCLCLEPPPASSRLSRPVVPPIHETRVGVSTRHLSAGEWVQSATLRQPTQSVLLTPASHTDDSTLCRGYSHSAFVRSLGEE